MKGAARDVCGVLKNGFPRRITLPRRLRLRPLAVVLSAVFTPGPGWIFFGKRTSATCPCPRRTIVLPRQITHLSDRVKTKDRVTDPARSGKKPHFQRLPWNRAYVTLGPGPRANHPIPHSVTFRLQGRRGTDPLELLADRVLNFARGNNLGLFLERVQINRVASPVTILCTDTRRS